MGRTSPLTHARRNSALSARKQAAAEMTPALKSVCQEMQSGLVDRAEDNLRFYHQIGKRCLEVQEHPEKYLTEQQRTQGVDPLVLMENFLGSSRSTMKRSLNFAQKYDSEDLKRLFAYRNADDPKFRLHWGHVGHLLSVAEARKRISFEEQAVQNLWQPDELSKHIIAAFNGPRRSGGRPLGVPRTVPAQLSQMLNMTSLFLRRKREVWCGNKMNVFKNIIEVPREKLTTSMMKDLEKLEKQWEEMQSELDEARRLVKDTLSHVRSGMEDEAADPTPPAGKKAAAAAKPAPAANRKSPAARAREVASRRPVPR